MYSIKYEDDDSSVAEKKTAKGIKRSVAKSQLDHESYKTCFLKNCEADPVEYYVIRSKNLQLYTLKEQKRTLCPLNNKRWMINMGTKYSDDPLFISKAFDNVCLKK